MKHISRREFGALLAAGVVAGQLPAPLAFGQGAAAGVTAGDIGERIRRHVGVPWKTDTVDGIKAGDPATRVTGVLATALASMEVLRRAVREGANLVVTSEPTFFGRSDARTPPAGADPVYEAKNRFIEANGIVIFRLSDHWRLRRPDPLVQGLADALGWSGHRTADDPPRYDIPAVTLGALAGDIKHRLGARGGIRVVGDAGARVRTAALLPGSTPLAASLRALPSADVIVAGEVREWESVEYARDAVGAGRAKGLVLVGRIVSEEPGMALCAEWLATLVPEVPVRHVGAGDPYWRPA